MELSTNRTAVMTARPMGCIVQEQGLELDYVLPDYYPDVCKLVKCFVVPTILSESISGDRLSYELRCEVRILYTGEHSDLLQSVTQVLLFSRTADLPQGEDISVEVVPEVDYVNCRAVSRRRLDVRGAVTIRLRTMSHQRQEVLSDADGKGLQLQRVTVQFPEKCIQTTQSIILTEDLELASTQPSLLHIVRLDARPVDVMQKFISGKLMAQGNLRLSILYACERDGSPSLEPLSFTLPFSQLLETDGLEEQDNTRIRCTVASCELKNSADPSGEIRALRCEAELRVHLEAVRLTSAQLLRDAFSTEHPCDCTSVELLTAGAPVPFSEMQVCAVKIPCTDSELDCVYDAWCDVRDLSTETDGNDLMFHGKLFWSVLVRESGGMPRLLEREEVFEHRFSSAALTPEDLVSASGRAENCSYTLTGGGEVSLKAELRLEGTLTHTSRVTVLSDLSVQEETAHPHEFALKLYYGKSGEPVWDIAKRCHTSVDAIMEENDLTAEILSEAGMLLIPIVNY